MQFRSRNDYKLKFRARNGFFFLNYRIQFRHEMAYKMQFRGRNGYKMQFRAKISELNSVTKWFTKCNFVDEMVTKCNSVTKWYTKFNFVNEMITQCNFVDEMVTKCNFVHEIIYRIQFRTQNAISWTKWFTEFMKFRARMVTQRNSWTKWFTEFNPYTKWNSVHEMVTQKKKSWTKWFTEFNSVHEMVTKCNSVHEMNFVDNFVTKLCKLYGIFKRTLGAP